MAGASGEPRVMIIMTEAKKNQTKEILLLIDSVLII